jgi:ATP-dependent Clp protease ATP-binding subunit ClpA
MVEPSETLQVVFEKAIKDAKKLSHEYVTVEHLLFAMLCEENFINVIKGYGADLDYLKKNLEHHLKNNCDELKITDSKYKPKKTQTVERVLNRAFTQVLFSGRSAIELSDVLISILAEKKCVSVYYLHKSKVQKDSFAEYVSSEIEDLQDEEMTGEATRALRAFTTNLNEEVKKQKVDPVIGRSDELESIALALGRRAKNNVLLVGDPGVGKTAIAEGMAYNIVMGNVPEFLKEQR